MPVIIRTENLRFKDRLTGTTITRRHKFFSDRFKVTSRVVTEIDKAFAETHTDLARRLCLPEATVRLIRMARLEELDAAFRPIAGKVIGIDECHLGRKALGLPNHSRKRGIGMITTPDGNRILALTRNTQQVSTDLRSVTSGVSIGSAMSRST